jgi:diadenosine tetraphosphate (Ap4A) HIT family hydrolase
MFSLRTPETETRYQKYKKNLPDNYCPFCDPKKINPPIKEYAYWIIIPNDYPYDGAFSTSDMLVCKRHVESEECLTLNEYEEYIKIRRHILNEGIYNLIQENSKPRRTVKPHFHIHLLNY